MTFKEKIIIPASVPFVYQQDFVDNYLAITKETGKLFLFAVDHKMEHMNQDFLGSELPVGINDPASIFDIATSPSIGAFATHMGLIERYAQQYCTINYVVKLNGKTSLISKEESDPISRQLWTIDDVLKIKETGISVPGVGYTIYLGSEYESQMLQEAAQIIQEAHHVGLITILWVYPRGRAISDDRNGRLAVAAAGVATSLGADFVKIKPPQSDEQYTQAEWLRIAQEAAGTTKVICSGEEERDAVQFLKQLDTQLKIGGIAGAAIGRNIFQRPKAEAEKFMRAVAALIYENADIAKALYLYGNTSR